MATDSEGNGPAVKSKGGRPKGSKDKVPRKRSSDKPPLSRPTGEAPEPEPVDFGNGDTPPGEPSPGMAGPKRRRVSKRDTKLIEDALREILCAPAMPCAIFGDEWAADHFEQAGAVLANKVAVVSERHPYLRQQCMKMLEGESIVVLGWAATAYVVPPLVHFGLLPGPASIPRFSLASRSRPEESSPAAGTEWAEREPNRPEPEVFGGEPTTAEFGGEDGGPPTYTEVVLG